MEFENCLANDYFCLRLYYIVLYRQASSASFACVVYKKKEADLKKRSAFIFHNVRLYDPIVYYDLHFKVEKLHIYERTL